MILRHYSTILIVFYTLNISAQVDFSNNWFFYEDSNQFTWVSSPQDWNRFNGGSYKIYSFGDTNSGLKGQWIQSSMFEDQSRNLYSTTYTHLNVYNPLIEKFTGSKLVLKQDTLSEDYYLFGIDTLSNSLFLKADSFLVRYNFLKKQVEEKIGITYAKRFELVNDSLIVGSKWGNGEGVEIFSKRSNIWHREEFVPEDLPTSITAGSFSQSLTDEDNVWLASNDGLYSFDLKNQKFQWYPIDSERYHLYSMVKVGKYIVLSTKQYQIQIFNLEEFEYIQEDRVKTINKQLLSDNPLMLYHNGKNRLWISFPNVGVQYINVSESFLDDLRLGSMTFNAPLKRVKKFLGNSSYYGLSDRSTIYNVSDDRIIFSPDSTKVINSDIQDFLVVDDKVLNVSGLNRLCAVDLNSEEILANHNLSGQLYFINPMRNDSIIISTSTGPLISDVKLNRIQPFKSINQFVPDNILKSISNQNSDFFTLTDGALIGLHNGSIIRFPSIGYVNHISKNTRNNSIIVLTEKGAYAIEENSILKKVLNDDEYFNESSIKGFEIDDMGNQWYYSSTGIYKVGIDGVNLRIPCKKDEILSIGDIPIIDNVLYVCSSSGTRKVLLDELSHYESKPSINITNIDINGIALAHEKAPNFVEELKLDYTENDVRVDFEVVEYFDQSLPLLKYRLNENEDWKIKKGMFLEFSSLTPNKYTLEYMGIGSNLISSDLRKLYLNISPPFWQTNWFRGMVVLALVSIGFLINHLRTKRLLREKQLELDRQKALQDQRNRMARNLHDEMGSGLTSIKYLSAEVGDSKTKKIGTLASNLIKSMRDLLWSLDENNDSLQSLISKSRTVVNQMIDNDKIKVHWVIQVDNNESIVSGLMRRNLILILKEATTNCMKHADAKNISISVIQDAKNLIYIIADDGIGFNGDNKQSIDTYGLNSIKKRAEEINAECNIQSSHRGTSIQITLPN